jgi:hypothetical protein
VENRGSPDKAFLDALGTVGSTAAPGSHVSVEQVAQAADLDRTEAIRIGLELIGDGLVDGVPLHGDDETKTINGLELTGTGRRALAQQRTIHFLHALDRATDSDPDAAVSAGVIGEEMGWAATETRRLASDGPR